MASLFYAWRIYPLGSAMFFCPSRIFLKARGMPIIIKNHASGSGTVEVTVRLSITNCGSERGKPASVPPDDENVTEVILFQLKIMSLGPLLSTVKLVEKKSVAEDAKTSICKPLFHAPVK